MATRSIDCVKSLYFLCGLKRGEFFWSNAPDRFYWDFLPQQTLHLNKPIFLPRLIEEEVQTETNVGLRNLRRSVWHV